MKLTAAPAPVGSRPSQTDDRGSWILGAVIAVFLVVHLARLGVIQPSGNNGLYYLRNALGFAHGHLPRSHYSPGFGFLLTPLAWITDGHFHAMYLAGSLVTLAVSGLAIWLIYDFLRSHVTPASALVVTAIFALGETATNFLFGVEVEPLALLLVVACLVAMDRQRSWLACGLAILGVACRVALTPFFAVFWLLHLRRRSVPALVALAGIGAAVAAHLDTQSHLDQSYLGIVTDTYGHKTHGQGPIAHSLHLIPHQTVWYLRFGIPAMGWPSKVLNIPLAGPMLGLLTSALIAFGAWKLVRHQPAVRAAVVAAATYLGLLVVWPVYRDATIRMALPVAPVILLSAYVGFMELRSKRSTPPGRLLWSVVALALASSLGVVATVHHTTPKFQALITANRDTAKRLPPGPVLSHFDALVRLVTGHEAVFFQSTGVDDLLQRASRVKACAFELDPYNPGRPRDVQQAWIDGGGARVLAERDGTTIAALEEPWCPAPNPVP